MSLNLDRAKELLAACRGHRVLVVGDSTGRGAANGLKRAAIPGLEIWDRTKLGCGMVTDSEECGD